MRMIRSWNRWVCTTQPRLTVEPVAEGDQVGLGQPVASRTRRRGRSWRPARAARGSSPGCPRRRAANHGAATISTKVSTTSLRQTNEHHSGCSTARIRPTSSHFAITAMAAGDGAGDQQHGAAEPAPPRRYPNPAARHCERRPARATPMAEGARSPGRSRHSSHERPGDLQPRRRVRRCSDSSAVGSVRRSRTGGLPSQDEPALALCGRRRQHRDQPSLGTGGPAAVDAGVAEERALADLGRRDVDPAAAELVGARPWCRRPGTRRRRWWSTSGSAAPSRSRRPRPTLAPEQRAATTGVSRLA